MATASQTRGTALPSGRRYAARMAERFRVVGGTALHGEVRVAGAKNSALKLMAVALLARGRTRLTNVPAILDGGGNVDSPAYEGPIEVGVTFPDV